MTHTIAALIVALVALANPATTSAASPPRWEVQPAPRFLVSAVLRKDVNGVAVKLVHGVMPASTADAAVGAFTRRVMREYPEYSLMDTIVTPLPSNCGYQVNV
uniref:hypothetical protein n=1 Tax=Cupriavidus gilardii TaxID=82541 RepID=UPI002478F7BF|nr:hypothetical protein [Cupriavidus gilardii]